MIVKQFSIYQYIVYPVLVMVMNAYSLIVHLLFKRLRNLLGKILIGMSMYCCFGHCINVLLDNSKFATNMPYCHNNVHINT